MVSAPKMATNWCVRLRFLLTIYACVINVVYVLLLYQKLMIVVCVLVFNHAFCLSEAGSTQSHLLAARKGISLVNVRTYFILHISCF